MVALQRRTTADATELSSISLLPKCLARLLQSTVDSQTSHHSEGVAAGEDPLEEFAGTR